MAVNQFNLYATFVEKEGHLIKLWGQVDRKSVEYIDGYLVRLNEQFSKGAGKPQPSTITVGQMCCAEYNGIFYRAKVTNIANITAGVVVVRFVDYGNSKVTAVDKVRIIDEGLASIPPQATEFYLYGVAPLTGADLEDVTIDYMRQHTCYHDLQAVLVVNINDKGLIKIYENGVDFGEMMVTQKLAISLDQQHQESLLRALLVHTLPPSVMQQHQWQPQAYIPSSHMSQKATNLPSIYEVHGNVKASERISSLTYGVTQQHSLGETTVKTFTSPILEPNSEHNVFVSNVEDGPLSFAVQLQAAEQTLIAVTADIAAHRPIPLREPPVPGSVCLARFPGDNKLSRATIMEVMDITCRLYYVDFGNINDVPYTDIFELPAKLINPKAMAVRFSLAGLKNGPPPSPVAKEAFKDVVRGCLLRLRVAASPEGPPLKQYGHLYREGRDVRMLYEELAKERIARNVCIYGIPPATFNASATFLMYNPPKAEAVLDGTWVTISHINSPDEFWVQLESDQSSLEQVMALLDECCSQSTRVPNVADLKLKSPIFARFSEDDRWYRANIVKVEQGKNGMIVHVEFVDYGNEEGISDLGRLRLAEPSIVKAIAAQAIRCRLNGAANIRYKIGNELWEKISEKFSDLTLETRGMVKLGPRGVGDPVVVLEELRDDTLSPPVAISMDALYKAVVGENDANQKANLTIITSNTTSDTWQEEEISDKDNNANSTVRYGDYSGSSRSTEQSKWNEGGGIKNWEDNKREERGRRVGGRNVGQESGTWNNKGRFGQQGNEEVYGGNKVGKGNGQHKPADDWENKDSAGQSVSEIGFRDGISFEGRAGRHGNKGSDDWDGKDSFVQSEVRDGFGNRGFRGNRGRQREGQEGGDWEGKESYCHSDGERFGRGNYHGRRGSHYGNGDGGEWENKDLRGQSDGESGSGRGGFRGGRGRRGGRDGGDNFDGDRAFGGGGFRGGRRGSRDGGRWENKDYGQKDGESGFRGGYRGGRGGHRGSQDDNEWDNRSTSRRGGFQGGHEDGEWESRAFKFGAPSDDGSSGEFRGGFREKRGGRGKDGGSWHNREKRSGWNEEGEDGKFLSSQVNKGVNGSSFEDLSMSKVVGSVDENWDTTEVPPETPAAVSNGKLEPFSGSGQEPLVKLGEKEVVSVVFVENRHNFYCHIKKHAGQLEEIMACLAEKYSTMETSSKEGDENPGSKPLKLQDMKVGMPCAALYSEDGMWYRARVVGEPKAERVAVTFVDYGNGGEVTDGGIRELKSELRSLPAQAIRCCLFGLPEDGEDGEGALDGDFELEVTSGESPLKVTFVRKKVLGEGCDCAEVVLRNKDTGDCINVRYGGMDKSIRDESSYESKECVEAASADDIPSLAVPIGMTVEVEVVYVVSRTEFYCQLKESSDKLQELMNSLVETCSKDYRENIDEGEVKTTKATLISLAELKVGMPCAALYSEDGMWYRARVVGEPKAERVAVTFVDYGNGGEVTDGGIRELKSELRSLPAQAIRCCLFGLPEDGEDGEGALDGDFELEVTSGESPLKVTFVRKKVLGEGCDCAEVVLRNKDTGDCINVRHGGMDKAIEEGDTHVLKIGGSEADQVLDIPPPCYSIGTVEEVEIVYVVSRHEFYCQLKVKSSELQDLMLHLAESCTKESKDVCLPFTAQMLCLAELKVGMPCAALYSEDGMWYRARVVGEPKAERVAVTFVDYGNGGEVTDGGIRELKSELRSLPAQAIRCCLFGLPEDGEDGEGALDGDFELEVTSGESPLKVTFVRKKVLGEGCDCVEVVLRNKDTGDCINVRYGGCEELSGESDASNEISNEDFASEILVNDIPAANIPFGSTLEVDIVYVVSRREFYCQIQSMSEKLQEVMDILASTCMVQGKEEGEVPLPCQRTLRMLGLRPGMPCAALFTEDNLWYRALVLSEPKVKDSGSGFVVNVKFVDYGNEAMVEDSGIQELIPELITLTAHAIPCRLMGLGDNFMPDADRELEFEAATMEPESSLEALFVQKAEGSDHFEILLKDLKTEENINKQFGAVGEVVGGIGFGIRPAMHVGCQLDVMVIWFVSPFRFYVQPINWMAGLQKYMESLQKVPKKSIIHWPPAVGTPVLARFAQDGGVYRAVVEDVTSNSMVCVQYVDYGNREALPSSQVWTADSSFKSLPPQAIPCALRGIAPKDTAGWPLPGCPVGSLDKFFSIEKCSCIFHDPLENESEVDGGMQGERRIWVSLIKPDGSSVAEELISAGLACGMEDKSQNLVNTDGVISKDGGQVEDDNCIEFDSMGNNPQNLVYTDGVTSKDGGQVEDDNCIEFDSIGNNPQNLVYTDGVTSKDGGQVEDDNCIEFDSIGNNPQNLVYTDGVTSKDGGQVEDDNCIEFDSIGNNPQNLVYTDGVTSKDGGQVEDDNCIEFDSIGNNPQNLVYTDGVTSKDGGQVEDDNCIEFDSIGNNPQNLVYTDGGEVDTKLSEIVEDNNVVEFDSMENNPQNLVNTDGVTSKDGGEVDTKLSEIVEDNNVVEFDSMEYEPEIETALKCETEDVKSAEENIVIKDMSIILDSEKKSGKSPKGEESEAIMFDGGHEVEGSMLGDGDFTEEGPRARDQISTEDTSLDMKMLVEKLGEIHCNILREGEIGGEGHQCIASESMLNSKKNNLIKTKIFHDLESKVIVVKEEANKMNNINESETREVKPTSDSVSEKAQVGVDVDKDQCMAKDITVKRGNECSQEKESEDDSDGLVYDLPANSIPVSTSQDKDTLDELHEFEDAEYVTTSDLAKDILRSSVDGDKDAAARVQQVVERYYQESPKSLAIDKIQTGRSYFTLGPADDSKVIPVKVLDLSGTLGAVVEFEDGLVDEVPLDKIYECPPEMAVLPSPDASPMSSLTIVGEHVIASANGKQNDNILDRSELVMKKM